MSVTFLFRIYMPPFTAAGLMVEEGFQPLSSNRKPVPLGTYKPPHDWETKFDNEWMFEYCRSGAAYNFRLHCALQSATRRVFIHASELTTGGDPIPDNIQIMGLQLDNYVPDVSKCKGATWEGESLADWLAVYVFFRARGD